MEKVLKTIKKNTFASCMPLISANRKELLGDIDSGVAIGCEFLEWRRDHFMMGEVLSAQVETDLLREMTARMPDQGLIYTYRTHLEGGVYETPDEIRKNAICAAIESNVVDYVDVELNSERGFLDTIRTMLKKSCTQWVVSHHNFDETPSEAEIIKVFSNLEDCGGDILKLAVMPKSLGDVRRLINGALNYGKETDKGIIAIAMGPLGGMTRIAADLCGGSLTYVAGTGKTAPGQLTLEEIMDMRKRMALI